MDRLMYAYGKTHATMAEDLEILNDVHEIGSLSHVKTSAAPDKYGHLEQSKHAHENRIHGS
jgi:hypothetical protein